MSSYFEIGGVQVLLRANFDFSQDYEPVGTYADRRRYDGSSLRLNSVLPSKIKTTLRGRGWQPHGLDGIDYSQAVLMKCGAPKSIASASNVIILPAGRRSDVGYEPYGYAVVNGERVSTGFDSVVTDTYTLTVVGGATAYELEYFPEIMVHASLNRTTGDVSKAEASWTINAEEV